MGTRILLGIVMLAIVLITSPAVAAQQIFATSYDLYNGGIAGYGNVTLYDDKYNGSGNKTTPYANLSGGLGDLTDGIAATQNWSDCGGIGPCHAENDPYVGWHAGNLTFLPYVTFHFAPNTKIDEVDISMNYGYHASPVDFLMGGVSETQTPPANYTGTGANQWYNFTGLDLNGDTLKITFHYNPTPPAGPADWVLLSEVQFFAPAVSGVPEPTTMLLLGLGLVGLAGVRRKFQK
jgi:hypothetical protein